MKQKTLLFIFILLSNLTANAYDAKIDGIYYNLITKAKQAEVTSGNTKYTGSVTIPESFTYDGVTYSVTSIGGSAFYGCSGLTSVNIPNSVTTIGAYAFRGCSGLTSVNIPNSVTKIEDYAFMLCFGLTSVTIGNSVTSISAYAFYGCSKLISVTIPNSVTSIGRYAFYGCSSLTSVTIPNSVTSIGESAFYECSKLTSVTIGNCVVYIGAGAFYGCSKLTAVHITDIGAWCKIEFSGNSSISNPLFYANHLFMNGEEITDLIIPNSVTSISAYAFYYCSGLTSVTIPNSVTKIGGHAFKNCSGLTSVTISNSVTSIGYCAFEGCSGLTSVTIPNSVTTISGAFSGCSGLTSVTIPNSVKRIESSAFSGCSGLTSVTIGSGVTYIGSNAFASCSELADIYCYAEKVPSTNSEAFKDSYVNYSTLYVPETSIAAYKAASPWNEFGTIKTLSGEIPVTPKCATPTISYEKGKLTFDCETEGATCQYSITDTDIKAGSGNEVQLTTTYKVTVYAKKDGFENSDVATKEIDLGTSGIRGDLNGDGTVSMPDAMFIVNKILNGKFPDE